MALLQRREKGKKGKSPKVENRRKNLLRSVYPRKKGGRREGEKSVRSDRPSFSHSP